MVDETYNFIVNKLDEASVLSGGPQRTVMGNLVENMIDFMKKIKQENETNLTQYILMDDVKEDGFFNLNEFQSKEINKKLIIYFLIMIIELIKNETCKNFNL